LSATVVGVAAEAGGAGPDDGLGPVGDLEFGEDAGYQVADCLGAEEEALGDIGVGVSGGDEVEDFAFACGQVGEQLLVVGR
jgi:hypothetical protein